MCGQSVWENARLIGKEGSLDGKKGAEEEVREEGEEGQRMES